MIYRIGMIIFALMVSTAGAQEERATQITVRVVEGVLLDEPPALSEEMERRVQTLVQKLEGDAEVMAHEERVQLVAQQKREARRAQLTHDVKSNAVKGVFVVLALLVVLVVVRKIGAVVQGETQKDKHSRLLVVSNQLRTAPCVVSLAMDSESDAIDMGRSLVNARLAARVDVFSLCALDAKQDGSLLLIKTVKGQLKALKKRLSERVPDVSAISIPVLKGNADYLNWIADAADGRG